MRAAVQFLVAGGLSVERACVLVDIQRSSYRYVAHPTDDTALLREIQDLAVQHPRYGYRRISVLLNRVLPLLVVDNSTPRVLTT